MISRYAIAFGALALAAIAPEVISRRSAHEVASPSESATSQAVIIPAAQRAEGLRLARRANELHAAKNYQDAVVYYDSAAARLPQIADWLNVFAAASSSYLGDTLDVTRRLAKVDSAIVNEFSWRTPIRAFIQAKQPARALQVATREAGSGNASKRAAAWYVVAELQRDAANKSAQRAALLRALEVAPNSEAALNAARALVSFSDLTLDERLRVGRRLLNGEPRRAITELRAVMAGTSDAKLRTDLRYEVGRTLFNLGSNAEAARELLAIPASHASADNALFLAGRAQHRERAGTGHATWRKLIAQYPSSPQSTRALFFLGDLAHDAGRLTEALDYFRKAGARQEPANEVAEALMRAGAILFAQGKYDDAAAHFDAYRARFTTGSSYEQATYWAARSYEKAGKQKLAEERLKAVDSRRSLSYYDLRAAELLQSNPLDAMPAGPAVDAKVKERLAAALDRWALLRELEWNQAAALELGRLKRQYTDNAALYAIGEGQIAHGQANAAIATGRELVQKGEPWNTRLLHIVYPFPYRDIIIKEAKSRGVDPYFVAGLMRQESWFNPRAVSGAGAVGLMQVMPATGRQLGRGENVGEVNVEKLKDPAINIRLGTKFLADLLRTHGTRTDAVLAAYNAGPSRVARWRQFPEFGNPDLFVERIPYDETRDYVRIVRVNTSIYRALYGTGGS